MRKEARRCKRQSSAAQNFIENKNNDLAGKALRSAVRFADAPANERADGQAYDGQPEIETNKFADDEKSHARLLAMASQSTSGLPGGTVAQLEGHHRASGGNALRAAVLGANDGLVSILSLTMGVAGATNSNTDVLIAGLAGLLAGAGCCPEWTAHTVKHHCAA